MRYIINVTRNNVFLFRVKFDNRFHMADAYREIAVRFPKSEGFSVTVTEWQTSGTELDAKELRAILKAWGSK